MAPEDPVDDRAGDGSEPALEPIMQTAIDTRMNGIIHAALRRDLDRLALVLHDPVTAPVPTERLRALGTHARWLMDLLHHHHTTEDDRLFPVLRRNNPAAAELLDQMESEHAAIADAVTALDLAGQSAEADEPGAATALAAAVADLRTVLDPHLEHEERDLSPIVPDSITEAEFTAFEKGNIAGKRPAALAFEGHWMLDNLDEPGAAVVRGKVPAVPRFVMLRLLGGAYRKRREACWAGTPAEAVQAVPLNP